MRPKITPNRLRKLNRNANAEAKRLHQINTEFNRDIPLDRKLRAQGGEGITYSFERG